VLAGISDVPKLVKFAFVECEFQLPNLFECECHFKGLQIFLFILLAEMQCIGSKCRLCSA